MGCADAFALRGVFATSGLSLYSVAIDIGWRQA